MNENSLNNRDITRRSFLAGTAAMGVGAAAVLTGPRASAASPVAVSYTHLTLPTSDLV
mgnify:CR=1 FL=1